MAAGREGSGRWQADAVVAAGNRPPAQPDAAAGTPGVPLDERQGSAAVWAGFRPLDTDGGGRADRAEVRHPLGPDGGEVFFWDESGFRADAVHGRTWGKKGQTPVVERPGQRQTISAASAVNAKGGFWYCTYEGGLTAELFVHLLRQLMRHRVRPVRLVVDGLPAHKTRLVKDYVALTKGRLTLHFLPGYAPDLNPDELVCTRLRWSASARARRGRASNSA